MGADIKKISNILSIKKEDIFLPIQRHTDKVLVVESDLESKIADAVVTKREGILIGVQVADCVPILLFDRRKFDYWRCACRMAGYSSTDSKKDH